MNVFDLPTEGADNIYTMCIDCIPTSVACNCAVIYEHDVDFGEITVVEPPLFRQTEILPSQKLSPEKLEHLTPTQRTQLFRSVR